MGISALHLLLALTIAVIVLGTIKTEKRWKAVEHNHQSTQHQQQ